MGISRRQFCGISGGALASLTFGACRRITQPGVQNNGRLTAQPRFARNPSVATGQIELRLDRERNPILQLPKTATNSAMPLLVMLHGAGQSAEDMFWYLGTAPEEAGVAVLAPNSGDHTWDAIGENFGADVELINRALELTFDTAQIDQARLAIGGFSDGASYGLSLGLINGDLFNRVVAFSPGFIIDGTPNGKPRFYVSHGASDRILPIDRCGRRIATQLKEHGYDVTFREFEGGHEIPEAVAKEALLAVATS
jgi:phospholipase/carboxylesterase